MSTKENILALLESSRGESVSGAHMAERLGITRNAVWKAVKELEKDGHSIQAVTNKGYCLAESSDILSVQGMLPFLSQSELAGRISIHASLESTNKTAKELAISGAVHGTTVIADSQTAGRGRYGRSFTSPPGRGLYMSFILHPARLKFTSPTLVTALAAVSVCESIEAVSDKTPRIKWVNDVFLDAKKICGILCETVMDFETQSLQWVVAGIGINVSTAAADFPEELRAIAGSVFPDGKPSVPRNRLAAEIVNRMVTPEIRYTDRELLKRYKKRLLMLGERVVVAGANETYEALAVDIDDIGRLIVEKDDGEVRSLAAGEISIKPR